MMNIVETLSVFGGRLLGLRNTTFSNQKAAHYQYQPLPTPTSIRLLHVRPCGSHTSAPVVCFLSTHERSLAPPYEALSYVWGPQEPTGTIHCADFSSTPPKRGKSRTMRTVRMNLYTALQDLRHKTDTRIMWIDGLCINQEDLAERASQVAMMGDIYRSATAVVVYLGHADYNHAFRVLKNLMLAALDFKPVIEGIQDTEELSEAGRHVTRLIRTANLFYDVENLFRLPWFTRCWTLQEIGLAKHAKLAYGMVEIPFGAFFSAVQRLTFHSGFEEPSKVEKFRKFISSAFIFNEFEMQKHPVGYKNLMKCTTFLNVLCEVRGRHATDLRDCVYAYLGHPTATALLEAYPLWMRPDYAKDPMLVHLDFARAYLDHTHDLRILSCVDHGDTLAPPEHMPSPSRQSWAPIWTPSNLRSIFGAGLSFFYYHASYGLPNCHPRVESDGIFVQGLHVDTVKMCSPILRNRDFDHEAWMLKHYSGLKTVTDMIRAAAAPSPYDDAQLALSFVLVAGMCDRSGIQEGHNLAQHILNFVNYTEHFKTDYPCIQLSRDETRSEYVSEAMEQIYLSVSKETRESSTIFPKYLVSLIAACDGRRVFITNKGYIGIGPAAMQAKDECYVLCGGSVPFLLRPTRYQTNQFVGEGYVYGLMEGEAAAMQTKDGLRLEEIHIC
jgi:hypothetical protein